MVTVRFAPSPTGYLHIGAARVALFNYLFARKHHGKFILRIEDTDIERSDEKFTESIIEALKFININYDEIYYQSKRKNIYLEYANKLKEKGYANNYEGAIKFKIKKEGKTSFDDTIRGKIEFDNNEFDDFIIIKSDCNPTYNFACVIDDALMNITHVIRGDDHITNTAKQIMLYQALEFNIPQFAHLPLILGQDKKRLSKRHGAKSIQEYKEEGILPEALINFLVRLSWAYDDKQEIFSLDELIDKFSLEGVTKNPAIFDLNKLLWLNAYYIRKKSLDELTYLLSNYLEDVDEELLKKIAVVYKDRLKKLSDIVYLTDYIFKDEIKIEEVLIDKFLKDKKEIFNKLIKRIKELDEFNKENLEKITRELINELNIKPKEIMQAMRVALTGREATPPLFDVMELIGKEKIIKRLITYIQKVSFS